MRSFILLLPVAVGAVSRTRGAAARNADVITAIQHRLDEEANDDKDVFDKLGCWCQSNLADKQQTVETMQSDNVALGHDIESQTAENARLNSELTTHQSELASNQQALDEANAMREKDAAKFADEEESHQQTVSSLDDALGSIKESHGHQAELSMAALFSKPSFLQFKTALKNKQSPEEVFGVLKHMKNTFGEQLKDIQHTEATMKTDHEALVGAKSQEIGALKKQIQSKNERYTTGKVQVGQKSEQVQRSQALLDADIELLNGMKELCQNNDDSFQARQSERQAEIGSLASALVDVAGDSFLSVNSRGQQPAEWGGPADELCMAAMSIVDETGEQRQNRHAKQPGRAACLMLLIKLSRLRTRSRRHSRKTPMRNRSALRTTKMLSRRPMLPRSRQTPRKTLSTVTRTPLLPISRQSMLRVQAPRR